MTFPNQNNYKQNEVLAISGFIGVFALCFLLQIKWQIYKDFNRLQSQMVMLNHDLEITRDSHLHADTHRLIYFLERGIEQHRANNKDYKNIEVAKTAIETFCTRHANPTPCNYLYFRTLYENNRLDGLKWLIDKYEGHSPALKLRYEGIKEKHGQACLDMSSKACQTAIYKALE